MRDPEPFDPMASQQIMVEEVFEDCGRKHACALCPDENECTLDHVRHSSQQLADRLAQVNWIIPVMANKGGVGKSSVACNLAMSLAQAGYAVGLADADVHGPSIPRLLGMQKRRCKLSAHGMEAPEVAAVGSGSLRCASLAMMIQDSETPVVWRDAYKHDYIHHLLGSFDWGIRDFLIVDMPPGTGNELITLAEILKGSNAQALLVSSADTIALQDTLKAATYCLDSAMPIVGLVENYAGVICPHCGEDFEMFPRSAEVERFAEMGVDTLARIPFTPEIGVAAARGVPAAADLQSTLFPIFASLAESVSERLVSAQRSQHQ